MKIYRSEKIPEGMNKDLPLVDDITLRIYIVENWIDREYCYSRNYPYSHHLPVTSEELLMFSFQHPEKIKEWKELET